MPSSLESLFSQQPKQPTGMLDRLKSYFSPSSVGGKVGNRDLYNQYASKAAENGEDVISFDDFISAMQEYQRRTK